MSKKEGLFKSEYVEKQKEEKLEKPNKSYIVMLTALYIKFNWIMLWITAILNGFLIVLMLMNFNVGIILFLFNQYFVILYLVKTRNERINKKKRMIETNGS